MSEEQLKDNCEDENIDSVKFNDGNDQMDEETKQNNNEELLSTINDLTAEINLVKSERDQEIEKLKNLNGMYVRLQSDFDNFRKRTTEQMKRTKEDGIVEALTAILPTLDVVNQALQMIKDENVSNGVKMIEKQLLNVLTTLGVEEISALGKPFDPDFHNAMLQTKAEKPEDEGKVMEVFQKGFKMGDRVLRHSVVKVAL